MSRFWFRAWFAGLAGGTFSNIPSVTSNISEAAFETVIESHLLANGYTRLAEKGFDPMMGARPMARLIQDTIRSALADELLFGRLVHGGKVTIDLDENDKVKLLFEEAETAPV